MVTCVDDMHLTSGPNSLGPILLFAVVALEVDRLGVVVSPGSEGVITCALAGPAVHLDLYPANLGTLGALSTLGIARVFTRPT